MAEVTTPQPVDPLAALEAEAAQLDAASMPVPVGQAEELPSEDTTAALFEALQFARSMAAPALSWWPEFGQAYSDDALQKIAAAGAAVMRRHGWTFGEMLEEWAPYIALVAAVAPPAMATVHAFKQRAIAQHQAALRQRQQQQGGPQHGSDQPAAH